MTITDQIIERRLIPLEAYIKRLEARKWPDAGHAILRCQNEALDGAIALAEELACKRHSQPSSTTIDRIIERLRMVALYEINRHPVVLLDDAIAICREEAVNESMLNPSDARLVDLMLKGARFSADKTSNRKDFHGALNAIRPFLTGAAEGLRADIAEIIRVARDNPADIQGFLQANYPKEWGAVRQQRSRDD